MNAMELLEEVRQMGGNFVPLPGGRLKVRASAPLPEAMLDRLRAAKDELIRALSKTQQSLGSAADPVNEEWKAYFDERAAMRQFCGGIPRNIAEELAWDDTLGEWHRTHPMEFPAGQCAGCGQSIGQVQALRLYDGNSVHFDTMNCLARYGETWRGTAAQSLKALRIEWPAVRNARYSLN